MEKEPQWKEVIISIKVEVVHEQDSLAVLNPRSEMPARVQLSSAHLLGVSNTFSRENGS